MNQVYKYVIIKKSKCYDGILRTLYSKKCKYCNKIIWIPKHRSDTKFCSRQCKSLSDRKDIIVKCAQCNTEFIRKPGRLKKQKYGLYFCNRKCKDIASQIGGLIKPTHYNDGSNNYRLRALRAFKHQCLSCGYGLSIKMLEADHINGRENHKSENLQLLCVWCHALKTRNVECHPWNGSIGALSSFSRTSVLHTEKTGAEPVGSTKINTSKRLSIQSVKEIKQLLKVPISSNKLSKLYSVSRCSIDLIRDSKSYKEV